MPEHRSPDPAGADEQAERALRRALAAEASAVDPGPAPRVGELSEARAPRRWPAALGVAAAVAALAVTSAVALRPGTPPAPVAAPSASAEPSGSTVEATPLPSPAPETSERPTGPSAVPSSEPSVSPTSAAPPEPETAPALVWSLVEVQLVDTPALRVVPDRAQVQLVPPSPGADPAAPEVLVRSAVQHLLSSPSPDPDHTNPWAAGGKATEVSEVSVSIGGSGTTVDLPASVFGGGLGGEAASAAVSALVRTVVSNGGPAPVTVLVDGQGGAEVWGVLVLDQPLSPGTDDLASGWILDPYEGQRVAAGTVTLSGTATAFEGMVNWAVLDADGGTVAEGATSSGSNGDYGPWSVGVELPPGTYTAVLRAENMAGDEGPGPWLWEETKAFTVS